MDWRRFAFSTNAFGRRTLDEALTTIAGVGFKGVEVLADKPHAWLDSFTPRDIANLAKRLEQLDLFVSNINANCTFGYWTDAPPEPFFEPSLLSRDKTMRAWRLAYSMKALRLGKALGAQNVSITSGRALNGVPPEKAAVLLEDGLKRLLDTAEKIGQRFSLEYEPGLFIERTAELAAQCKKLKSPLLGANLDIGHVVVAGEDPSTAIRALKGRIFNLHLEDIKGGKHWHRVPGEGDIDFKAVFKTLDAIRYTGPLTWELYTYDEHPEDACRKCYVFTKKMVPDKA